MMMIAIMIACLLTRIFTAMLPSSHFSDSIDLLPEPAA